MRSRRSSPIEPLEARIAPATLMWDGSAGDADWFNSLNWDQNVVPGATDTAILAISSTINLSTDATVAAFQQSAGTFTSGANVTLTILARFDWTGGTQSGAGTTAIGAGATLTLGSSASKTLLRTLVNSGTADWSGGGVVGGGTFANNGVFNASAGDSFFPTFTNAPGATFNQLSATNGFQGGFNNSGTVNVTGGTLNFGGGGTSTHIGIFNVATAMNLASGIHQLNGATIRGAGDVGLNATAITFDSTAIYNVSGTTSVTGGTVTLNTSSTAFFGTLNQSGGTLTGNANFQVNAAATWNGGTMSGAGTTTIVSGATLTLSGGATKTLDRQLSNQGTTGWTGGAVSGSSLFTNNNLFIASADNSFTPPLSNAAAATFTQSAGTNAFTGSFANSGAINLNAGTLALNGGFAQTAGAVSLNGGALSTTGALSFNGGELRGAGTITGNVDNFGGTVRPAGAGVVGTITITGSYTQGASGTLVAELAGTGVGQFDQLRVTGNATVDGALEILVLGAFAPVAGNSFRVVQSANNPTTFTSLTGATAGITQTADASGVVLNANGLTFIWDAGAGADTNWFNPLNWDRDSGVPGMADAAILNIDATINLPSGTSVGTFMQSNPTFVGANAIFTSPAGSTLTILNSFNWTGGTQSGAGATTVAAGATLSISTGGQDVMLDQRTLNLNGTAIFPSAFTSGVAFSNGATINNRGVMDFQGPVVFAGTGTFNNLAGATVKNTTTNHTVIVDNPVAFTNAGIVQSQIGTLAFNGGYIQTAGSTEMVGGRVSVSGMLMLNGGTFIGAGLFVGSINNSGGIIRPGGAGAIGTITTNGDYMQTAGGTVETELGGTGAGQFDVFAPGGVASITGTLTAPLLGGFVPPAGSQFAVFTAGNVSGTFTTPPANVGIQYAFRSVTLLGPVAPVGTVVTTEMDVVNANDGVVSLREAITFANSNAGLDTISFNIPGAGLHSIRPASALPVITDPVNIDGFSQPGASRNTGGPGAMDNAVRLIEVSGVTSTTGTPNGLQISAGGSTVEGLIVTRWRGAGIVLETLGGNTIAGNLLGADADGNIDQGNLSHGLSIINSPGNTIGGVTPGARNRMVGNTGDGISISGTGATGNLVLGNFIGTDGSTVGAEGNRGSGVNITGGGGNTIGGTTPGARNIISGAIGDGVLLKDTSGNVLAGNFIGTNVAGTAPIPNTRYGVFLLDAATNNVIGGTAAGAGNVISGNGFVGVLIGGKTFGQPGASTGNRVEGNFIGTNASSAVNLGNNGPGIRIENNAANNTIGGGAAGAGNVISANGSFSVVVDLAVGAVGNAIQGNFIGTDPSGASLGNARGLAVSAPSGAPSGLLIGGTAAGEGNVIAFNGLDAITVDAPSRGVVILGNSMHDNNGLGIDLGTNGFTPNDAGDGDPGANDLQNFPVLTAVTPAGGATMIAGTLNSTANTVFRVELFTTDRVDGNGIGEGRSFLGFVDVTTNSSGDANWSTMLASQLVVGTLVTATATQMGGAGTSEFAVARAAAGAPELAVTTLQDVVDAADGVVSLREAIIFANANAGLDTITFNIPGAAAGVRTIRPTSLLPAITDAVVIDGYSQPGASVNTLAQGSNAVLTVELSGPGAGGRGLQIDADNSLVRGLIINRFNNAPAIILNGDGIRVEGCFVGTDSTGTADFAGGSREGLNISGTGNIIGGTTPETRNVVSGHTFAGINIIGASGVGNNLVQGNMIGVDKTGTAALGNGTGIAITGLTGNTIGGPTAAARNVISSNNAGINIFSGSNTVQGNFIGVDVTGAAALGNSGTGIFMQGAAGNLIGGLSATAGQGAGNVISGNGNFGIDVNGNAAPGHIIQGNLIGTDATGTIAIANSNGGINIRNAGGGNLVGDTDVQGRNVISGNGQHGLLLDNGANRVLNNYIGVGRDGSANLGNARSGVFINSQDSNALTGNVIAFNGEDGIGVNFFGSGTGNAFVSNSIFANGDLGIDLGNNGVTPNDPLDADTGANGLQNFPVLTSAMSGSGATSISGTLNSTPNASFRIEFYASFAADPSGFGEGQVFLGFANVTTDASGNAPTTFSPVAQLTAGSQITATATDAAGNTSEFSAAILAQINSTPGGRSVTVTDVDGDRVIIKVNKGSIPPGAITMGPNGIELIDLRAAGNGLAKSTLTIDAQQIGSGDGVVNVGAINAAGINLLKIRVDGDLGQIDIGAGDARKPALKSLVVGSLGAKGATTQVAGTEDPLLSEVKGALGKLTVGLDVQNAVVEVSGKLGKVLIGGDLIDSGAPAPLTQTPGSIGVFLNGGIPPANASHAGAIFAPNIGSVTVMGDVNGGEISAEAQIKNVKIAGKLMSDNPLDPAILRVGAGIDKVVVNGDVKNALILAGYNRALEPRAPDASIGKVTVKGNWSASSVVAGVSDPTDNGFGINDMIIAGDTTPDVLSKIARVIIKGTATGSATLTDHSAITAQKIGALRIFGARIPLATGPDNVLLDPLSQNFRAVEL